MPLNDRENPAELLSYKSRSSVAVGDPGLSPLEATAVLGGILLVIGGVTYLWLKSPSPTATVIAPVAPVPAPTPVQPIPIDPSSPGY
jgi:hypothetical protein